MAEDAHIPLHESLAVFPGPGSWNREPRPTVSMLVLDDLFGPEVAVLSLVLDDEALTPTWDPTERTVTGRPRDVLPDGSHRVALAMQDANARVLEGAWSFYVDTVPPVLDLAPLPAVAEKRLVDVTGTFTEAHLQDIQVNGFSPIIEGNAFRVQVLLWPGSNEIEARALDLAGNVGLGAAEVQWFPSASVNLTFEPFHHANRSFRVEFPSSWDIQVDFELDSGTRADVLASGPGGGGLRPTITVFSRFAGETMNEALFLTLMEDTLINLGSEAKVQVISRPNLVDSGHPTLAAQFTVVQTLPQGPRAFVLVTGFWSNSVRRVWLVVGATATERVEEDWLALARAAETFAAVEPILPPTEPFEPPQTSVNRALVVTVAASVFILAFFGVVLLYRRRKNPPPGG